MRERIIIFELIKKTQTLEFRDSCTITNNEINIQASFEYISQNTVTVPINNSVRMKLIVSFHIDQYLNITSKIEDIQLQPEVGKSMVLSKYVWGALGFEHDIMPRYENIPHLHMQSKYPQNSFQTPPVNNTQGNLLTGIPEIGGDINSNIGGIAANGGDAQVGNNEGWDLLSKNDVETLNTIGITLGGVTALDYACGPEVGIFVQRVLSVPATAISVLTTIDAWADYSRSNKTRADLSRAWGNTIVTVSGVMYWPAAIPASIFGIADQNGVIDHIWNKFEE